MGKLQVVVGGLYGSEAKGAVCAHLARQEGGGTIAVRVAGPNAGHTAVDDSGRRWPLRTIPVAAVADPGAQLAIAAGSEIEIAVLLKEIRELEEAGFKIRDRLTIDPMATILDWTHQETEAQAALTERVGSTGKGIGAARAARTMRQAQTVRDTDLGDLCTVAQVAPLLREHLWADGTAQVEGTQGFGLGLHHQNYPQVTSSDCRAVDFLAMAGVSPWDIAVTDFEVWVVYRPYPIRVAGNSGPLAGETTWTELGLPEERTTVTQKIRRVGLWDAQLAREAVAANGGPGPHLRVALTMGDQICPAIAGATTLEQLNTPDARELWTFIGIAEADLGAPIDLLGTSDRTMVALT